MRFPAIEPQIFHSPVVPVFASELSAALPAQLAPAALPRAEHADAFDLLDLDERVRAVGEW
jgi:hypothetical protein